MNGGHDLGGRHGLGPLMAEAEASEPVFHSEWERRVFAMTLAAGMLGKWNLDESRFARERQHPADYLRNSYYENWLQGLETLLEEKNLLTADNSINLRIPAPDDATKILKSGAQTSIATGKKPAFKVGDGVRLSKFYNSGHTRAPAYAQGAEGCIARLHGCHIFPDRHVLGDANGEHLYSVCFSSQQLWAHDQDNFEILIDLWEPYLQRVPADA